MGKTADRKLEIAKRLKEIACDDHGLDPELLIFDALTFTETGAGPDGERSIPLVELHRLPGGHPEIETELRPGELIVAVELPPSSFARVALSSVANSVTSTARATSASVSRLVTSSQGP